ncbi:MAG: hypothetical protein ACI4GV_05770 [Acutalibacteraceae bacterium]
MLHEKVSVYAAFSDFVALCSTSFSEVLHEKVSVYAAFSDFVALLAFFEYFFI